MMKKLICLLFTAVLICCMAGCYYSDSGDIQKPVEFFYPRKTSGFVYGSADGVIASEIREASGHVDDLNYLITMYLYGPQDTSLRSPFPTGCKLENIRIDNDTLYIHLSSDFTALSPRNQTIACAALAKTCFTLSDFDYICIDASVEGKTVSVTLDKSSILFADYSAFEGQTILEEAQ